MPFFRTASIVASLLLVLMVSPGIASAVVSYTGSIYSNQLSCSPAYQTVAIGTPSTFFAAGGTGGYNWVTADRTFLNVNSTLSVVLQTTGMQTVSVSNGIQTAVCTINVVNVGAAAMQYSGTAPISLVSNYTPALLPNTGYGPLSGVSLAFVIVVLFGAGILFYPYVKKAIVIATH